MNFYVVKKSLKGETSMKKFFAVALVFAVAVALTAAMGCTGSPTTPTATATPTLTPTSTNTPVPQYQFGANITPWTIGDSGNNCGITAVAWNNAFADANAGTGCLEATADFNANTWTATGEIMIVPATALDMSPDGLGTSPTVYIDIYVPAALVGAGYGMTIGVNSNSWGAYANQWINIDQGAAGWYRFTWNALAGCNYRSATEMTWNAAQKITIQVLRNSSATAYAGPIYFDNFGYK